MSDDEGLQGRGPHALFGAVGCTIKILMGEMVDGGRSERCLRGAVASLRHK